MGAVKQLDLFDTVMAELVDQRSPAQPPDDTYRQGRVSAPSWIKNGVVHVHLTGGLTHSEPLPIGPLTRGECAAWIAPCKLYKCRYRLDDLTEMRTRQIEPEYPDDDEISVDEYEGPRDKRGAYYSETQIGPGTWCALTVADEGGVGDGREIEGNISLAELGKMAGVTRESAREDVQDALDELAAVDAEDIGAGRILRSFYGDRGSVKLRTIQVEEEIDFPSLKIAVKAAKEPRSVPSVKRRPRKSVWAGITRVVPAAFAGRVDVRLMDPMGTFHDRIPEQFVKPLKPPTRRGSGT